MPVSSGAVLKEAVSVFSRWTLISFFIRVWLDLIIFMINQSLVTDVYHVISVTCARVVLAAMLLKAGRANWCVNPIAELLIGSESWLVCFCDTGRLWFHMSMRRCSAAGGQVLSWDWRSSDWKCRGLGRRWRTSFAYVKKTVTCSSSFSRFLKTFPSASTAWCRQSVLPSIVI